ncbi:MAG TPA: branched-chain amino acid ABC transporter permease [Myxococcaceae bacterium]|jgi:branched-chain amino acid transport system permease protein|nr:branched-chain amino acid ABC transporter permease [Myxococcaceae bacterium]
MDLLAQYVMNGVMLGLMYALVALGFTLFFGVLNVIQFAHGDVLTAGAFAGLAGYAVAVHAGVEAALPQLLTVALAATLSMALLGAVLGRALVLPLKGAPALNVLLATLMGGTALRECIRLFYPGGSQPQRFPALLPSASWSLGRFTVRLDNLLMLATGVGLILGLSLVLQRTRLGLAIRAVAQDEETARTMGIDFRRVVLLTFAIGSALAAFAGVMNGLYYNEVNFGSGLLLGVIGFSAAVLGGLGNLSGALLGGFLFAGLQTLGAVAMPFASAYKDVFAFGMVILLLAWRPTGLIGERLGERV